MDKTVPRIGYFRMLSGDGCTEQTDIWSIGVIAFILLSRSYPFLRGSHDLEDEERKILLRMQSIASAPSGKKEKFPLQLKTLSRNHSKEILQTDGRQQMRWNLFKRYGSRISKVWRNGMSRTRN